MVGLPSLSTIPSISASETILDPSEVLVVLVDLQLFFLFGLALYLIDTVTVGDLLLEAEAWAPRRVLGVIDLNGSKIFSSRVLRW